MRRVLHVVGMNALVERSATGFSGAAKRTDDGSIRVTITVSLFRTIYGVLTVFLPKGPPSST